MNTAKNIDRAKTLNKLRARQKAIQFESEEDEGAMEHFAEVQSVINTIESGASQDQICEAARWVGLDTDIEVRNA